MSYKTAFPFKGCRNSAVVVLAGSIAPNGSSALVAGSSVGQGFTAVRTGVGIFTLTLDDSYTSLLSSGCSVALSAVANTTVQFGAIDVTTAKTVVINVLTAGVAADIAANAANKIHFQLFLRDSTVTP